MQGEYTWTLNYELDKEGDQCSCFGVTKLPVDGAKYERNSCMWVVRCYNGSRYKFGSEQTGKVDKIPPGRPLHFRLNMATKTLSMAVGDGPMSPLFTDVEGTVRRVVCGHVSRTSPALLLLHMSMCPSFLWRHACRCTRSCHSTRMPSASASTSQ